MTEKLWAGAFGDAYRQRNDPAALAHKRLPFWADLQRRYPVESVLEVGCNAGPNLAAIARSGAAARVIGCDVNERALLDFRLLRWSPDAGDGYMFDPRRHGTFVASAAKLPPDLTARFELVFTAGVLIHLPADACYSAMSEMVRVSARYVLAIEYHAATEVEVPYRGQREALWKRPYDLLFMRRFPELRLLENGVLTPEDGFDNCGYWMFEKEGTS